MQRQVRISLTLGERLDTRVPGKRLDISRSLVHSGHCELSLVYPNCRMRDGKSQGLSLGSMCRPQLMEIAL